MRFKRVFKRGRSHEFRGFKGDEALNIGVFKRGRSPLFTLKGWWVGKDKS
jgi:hypothetical protein